MNRQGLSAASFRTGDAVVNSASRLADRLASRPLWWGLLLASGAAALPFYLASYLLSPEIAWVMLRAAETRGGVKIR